MKDSYIFYTDKLRGEFKDAFEQVEFYVNSLSVNSDAREERLGEFLDLLLTAQEEGRSVESVVGNDMERFCKSFCSDFGPKNTFLLVLDTLKFLAWYTVVLSLLDVIMPEEPSPGFFELKPTFNLTALAIVMVMSWAVIGVLDLISRRSALKSGRMTKSMKVIYTVVTLLAVCAAAGSQFIETPFLPQPPVWVCLSAGILFLVLYYALVPRPKRGKIKLVDLAPEAIDDTMMKEFAKKNKKRLKKEKTELTLEEFLDLEESACAKNEKEQPLFLIIPLIIIGVVTVPLALFDGFESVLDGVIFVAILLVVEYALMLFFRKVTRTGIDSRRAWIRSKRGEK